MDERVTREILLLPLRAAAEGIIRKCKSTKIGFHTSLVVPIRIYPNPNSNITILLLLLGLISAMSLFIQYMLCRVISANTIS